MKLKLLHQRLACGECTACCHVFEVPQLEKTAYRDCRHQGRGCAIHADRPSVCRDFVCAYAQGLLGESESRRPDRSGLLLQVLPSRRLQVWEVRRGAFDDTDRLAFLARRVESAVREVRGKPVALYPYGSAPGVGNVEMSRFERFENWLVFKG